MKPLSKALTAHYQQALTTVTRCARIERQDGVVLGLTEHDQDLFFEALWYRSIAGYQSSAVQLASNLAVGTVEIEGILQAAGVKSQEIVAGLFDLAAIDLFEVNYTDLSQGKLTLLCGYWGETQVQGARFVTEFRSTAQSLQKPVGECYSPTCRAQLGDTRCGVDLEAFTHKAEVTAVLSATVLVATALTQAEPYFQNGHLQWLTGANAGLTTAIKEVKEEKMSLLEPPPYPVQSGDTFSARAGCDKRLATCRDKFNNVIHFRGEPYVPEHAMPQQ